MGELCMAAVAQDGYALKWVSEEMKLDREIIGVATGVKAEALQGASDEKIRTMVSLRIGEKKLRDLSEEMKGDRELCMAAVAKDKFELEYAGEAMKNNEEVVAAAIEKCSWKYSNCEYVRRLVLSYASTEMRQNGRLQALCKRPAGRCIE